MDQVIANKNYEHSDHAFRDQDHYANGKYLITLRWLRSAQHLSGKALMNIGCGAGHFNQLACGAGFKVTGVEPDAKTSEMAKVRSIGSSVKVITGTIDSVERRDKFDVVVAHDVMEHIQDDKQFLADIHGKISSDGLLILSVPALPWLFGIHDENLGHFRRYTLKSLQAVMAQNFEIQDIRYYGFVFIPVTYFLSVVFRKPYPTEASSEGLLSKILKAVCSIEARLRPPLGTAIILSARPRK